jgi:hypothetical protein
MEQIRAYKFYDEFFKTKTFLYLEITARFNAFCTGVGNSAEINDTEAGLKDGLISMFVF